MNRRNFVSHGVSALGIGTIASALPINNKEHLLSVSTESNLYLTLSGNLKSKGFLGIGLLRVENPEVIDGILSNLRMDHNFHQEFKYSSSNRHRIDPTKSLLAVFKARNTISYFIKLVENPYDLLKGKSPSYIQNLRLAWYEELLESAAADTASVPEIVVKSESAFGPSRNFCDKISTIGNSNFTLRPLPVYESNLLQMCSLLTGNVVAETRNELAGSKWELWDFLRRSLGGENLATEKTTAKLTVLR